MTWYSVCVSGQIWAEMDYGKKKVWFSLDNRDKLSYGEGWVLNFIRSSIKTRKMLSKGCTRLSILFILCNLHHEWACIPHAWLSLWFCVDHTLKSLKNYSLSNFKFNKWVFTPNMHGCSLSLALFMHHAWNVNSAPFNNTRVYTYYSPCSFMNTNNK